MRGQLLGVMRWESCGSATKHRPVLCYELESPHFEQFASSATWCRVYLRYLTQPQLQLRSQCPKASGKHP